MRWTLIPPECRALLGSLSGLVDLFASGSLVSAASVAQDVGGEQLKEVVVLGSTRAPGQ